MKKLDPLYIILISFTILMISIVLLQNMSKSLIQSHKELNNIQNTAVSYSNIKNNWGDKKYTIKLVDNIIKSININVTTKKISKHKIMIQINKISSSKLDKFINKILNEKLNIVKLKITKNTISLEVGI